MIVIAVYCTLFLVGSAIWVGLVFLVVKLATPKDSGYSDLWNWESQRVHWNGRVATQHRVGRHKTEIVDPSQPYRVSWDHHGDYKCVYTIQQEDNFIRISTNDPDAPFLLKTVFKVNNYPCEDLPGFVI